MKSKNCDLKTELMDGLLQYEEDTNLSPQSVIESLVEDFLIKKGYLVISNSDEFISFPSELNKPPIRYANATKSGKFEIRKNKDGKNRHYGVCEYHEAILIVDFLKRKDWNLNYSTSQTKLKGRKQIEFLLNEIEKENELIGTE